MKLFPAIVIAVVFGVLLRFVFGLNEIKNLEVMSFTFLVINPFLVGVLTTILARPEYVKVGVAAFFLPWITSVALLLITILLDLEGTICWILLFPAFLVLSGVGGLTGYYVRKYLVDKNKINAKPNIMNSSVFFLVPCIIGMIEGNKGNTRKDFIITKSITINASDKKVWEALTHINDINTTEHDASLSQLIGFPKHTGTTLDTLAVGGKRKATYERGLYFNETITQLRPNRLMVVDIKTDPTHIPPTVMDEHIIIGGEHVDILQDTYRIEKLTGNSCTLSLSSKFYINTPLNWYAGIWSEWLMSDILKSELELVKKRAEQAH